jgi:pimeloyl-ACP methyl ester carboxylesterase
MTSITPSATDIQRQSAGSTAGAATAAATSTGSVVSNDGTTIGYLRFGSGPALVVYHGAMTSAHSFTQLAGDLAARHTVYVPDRRGRGLSGPFPADYSIATEVADLEAVLDASGAHDVFAISAGALVAMQTALTDPRIQRLALYEPALSVNGSLEPAMDRLDKDIAAGNAAGALVTGMLEADLGPPIFKVMPRALLERMTSSTMKSEEKKAAPGDVTMRMLAPTQHYDFELIHELSGTLERYRALTAKVLLLGGSKSPGWARVALDALERTIPNVSCAELAGLDHGGPTNPSAINRASNPDEVAEALRRFFA